MESHPTFEQNNSLEHEISGLKDLLVEQECVLSEKLAYLSREVLAEIEHTKSIKETVKELRCQSERDMKGYSMKTLQDQIDDLRQQWNVITGKGNDGKLQGQLDLINICGLIAVYVEKAICLYVLPEVYTNTKYTSLHDLLNVLNSDEPFPLDPDEFDCEEVLREATRRWEMVCKEFEFPNEWITKTGGWNIKDDSVPGDIRAIEILKPSRVSIACQKTVSLKYAEQNVESIKGKMPPWQYDLVAPFIGSLRGKMIKSKLHHDKLSLL